MNKTKADKETRYCVELEYETTYFHKKQETLWLSKVTELNNTQRIETLDSLLEKMIYMFDEADNYGSPYNFSLRISPYIINWSNCEHTNGTTKYTFPKKLFTLCSNVCDNKVVKAIQFYDIKQHYKKCEKKPYTYLYDMSEIKKSIEFLKDFCKWVETLPYAKELIIGE